MTAIEVTVRDPETGDSETQLIEDDYVLVTAGTCVQTHVQVHGGGATHVITVKGRRPAGPAGADQ